MDDQDFKPTCLTDRRHDPKDVLDKLSHYTGCIEIADRPAFLDLKHEVWEHEVDVMVEKMRNNLVGPDGARLTEAQLKTVATEEVGKKLQALARSIYAQYYRTAMVRAAIKGTTGKASNAAKDGVPLATGETETDTKDLDDHYKRLTRPKNTSHLVTWVDASRMAWRDSPRYKQGIKKVQRFRAEKGKPTNDLRIMDDVELVKSIMQDQKKHHAAPTSWLADGLAEVKYEVERDINGYLIQFQPAPALNNAGPDSANPALPPQGEKQKASAGPYIQAESPSPRVKGHFPDQRISLYEVLNDNKGDIFNSEAGKDRIQYFHIPCNNMEYAERIIAKYFGEDRPGLNADYKDPSLRSKSYMLLRPEYWRGQQHGDRSSVVHARHMRPLCEIVSSAADAVELDHVPSNLVLFMPYLHWETDRNRDRIARVIDEETEKYQQQMRYANAVKKKRREEHRRDLQWDVKHKVAHKKEQLLWDSSTEEEATELGVALPQTAGDGLHGGIQHLAPIMKPYKVDRNGRRQSKHPLGQYLLDAARLYEAISTFRDQKLLEGYLHHDPPLHPRRTLDQSYYWTLKTTKVRDRDQVVYRSTTMDKNFAHHFVQKSKGDLAKEHAESEASLPWWKRPTCPHGKTRKLRRRAPDLEEGSSNGASLSHSGTNTSAKPTTGTTHANASGTVAAPATPPGTSSNPIPLQNLVTPSAGTPADGTPADGTPVAGAPAGNQSGNPSGNPTDTPADTTAGNPAGNPTDTPADTSAGGTPPTEPTGPTEPEGMGDEAKNWKWEDHHFADDQHGCEQCRSDSRKISRVVMVDQLWMWILDRRTIVTCFPRRYGVNKQDPTGVHKSIRMRLAVARKNSIRSVFDLALIILDECSNTFFDRTKTKDREPQVTSIFSEAIGKVTHKQTILFDKLWHWTEEASKMYRTRTNHPNPTEFHAPLLDISDEGKLQREIKDIIDELDIMIHLSRKQYEVLKRFVTRVESILDEDGVLREGTEKTDWDSMTAPPPALTRKRTGETTEQQKQEETLQSRQRRHEFNWFRIKAWDLLNEVKERIVELEGLRASAESTAKSVTDLLGLKQQQASVVQAWQSVKQGEETVRQGRSIFIFTIVTIIFLPLAFMSSVFGMNNSTFTPEDERDGSPMSLRQQINWMLIVAAAVFFVSLSIALRGYSPALIRTLLWSWWIRSMTWLVVRTHLYNVYLWITESRDPNEIVKKTEKRVERLKDKVRQARRVKRREGRLAEAKKKRKTQIQEEERIESEAAKKTTAAAAAAAAGVNVHPASPPPPPEGPSIRERSETMLKQATKRITTLRIPGHRREGSSGSGKSTSPVAAGPSSAAIGGVSAPSPPGQVSVASPTSLASPATAATPTGTRSGGMQARRRPSVVGAGAASPGPSSPPPTSTAQQSTSASASGGLQPTSSATSSADAQQTRTRESCTTGTALPVLAESSAQASLRPSLAPSMAASSTAGGDCGSRRVSSDGATATGTTP